MEMFALEVFNDEGNCCTFYSVRWENQGISETDKFFQKFQNDTTHKIALQKLVAFLEVVMEEKGAQESFFRLENDAHALPPQGKRLVNEVTIDFVNFPLRLYFLRLSDALIVLFNGAEKTGSTAQGGKTSMVFAEANAFAKRILAALYQKDIFIENKRKFVLYNGTDEIYL